MVYAIGGGPGLRRPRVADLHPAQLRRGSGVPPVPVVGRPSGPRRRRRRCAPWRATSGTWPGRASSATPTAAGAAGSGAAPRCSARLPGGGGRPRRLRRAVGPRRLGAGLHGARRGGGALRPSLSPGFGRVPLPSSPGAGPSHLARRRHCAAAAVRTRRPRPPDRAARRGRSPIPPAISSGSCLRDCPCRSSNASVPGPTSSPRRGGRAGSTAAPWRPTRRPGSRGCVVDRRRGCRGEGARGTMGRRRGPGAATRGHRGTPMNVLLVTLDQFRGRLPVGGRPPRGADAEPRPAGRRGACVSPGTTARPPRAGRAGPVSTRGPTR